MLSSVLPPAEHRLLKSLLDYKVRFLIVGLSSAVIQGAHVATQDIDLWVEDLSAVDFKDAIKSAGAIYIPPGPIGQNPPMLGPEEFRSVDLVAHMHGLDTFQHEYANSISVTIDELNLKLLPLARIIVSKRALGREKDKAVLPILEATLKVIQDKS